MCGIVGYVGRNRESRRFGLEKERRALASIEHRGPDSKGEHFDGKLWMGHVRLSILDLSSAGNQPMVSDNGRYVISYNGEVYNYRELIYNLSLKNIRSGSDTEVVLSAFEKYGVDSIVEMNGQFAFAMYDKIAQKLWLVRDRLGIKPLYYYIDENYLLYSSEIEGIISLGYVTPECDVSSLHEWLYYGNSLGGQTLYRGIRQLLPGHCLELDIEKTNYTIQKYWSIESHTTNSVSIQSEKCNLVIETRKLLEQAVRRQLVSDVPVGVFLSGGIDSSAIVAFASRHYKGRLATYSVDFDFNRNGGELTKAKRTASLYGTDHHEIHIEGNDVENIVEKMIRHHGMPFSDAANIPLFMMASSVSEQTKVVLQGDGGDELFGGYRRYSTLSFYRWIHYVSKVLCRFQKIVPRTALKYRALRYLNAYANPDLAITMALLLTTEDKQFIPEAIFSKKIRKVLEKNCPFKRFRECQKAFSSCDIGNQMSFVDLMIVLPDIYLEKVDRSTMATGLEVRVPFLDNDLVEFIVQLPSSVKVPFGKKKWLLKLALDGLVLPEILYGPKTGFNVPFGNWLQTSLKQLFFDNLYQFAKNQPEVLDINYINRIYKETMQGKHNHSFMLWKILNLVIWANAYNIAINDK